MEVKKRWDRINFDSVNKALIELKGEPFKKYRDRWMAFECVEKSKLYDYIPDFPIHIDFEVVFGCNLRCTMCWLQNFTDYIKNPVYMEFELYKKIIDEGMERGLNAISLHNIGEPLIRSDIFDFLKYGSNAGLLDIFLSTNGTLLNEEASEKLIDYGLTRLNVSLDAFTEETYKKMRNNNQFNKVKENIEKFLEIRKKKNSKTPFLRVSFCKTIINEKETDDFINYWSSKVDNIGIQRYQNVREDINLEPKEKIEIACYQPFRRVVVLPDGRVQGCCVEYGYDDVVVGNAYESSIHDIWHSKRIQFMRDVIANNTFYKMTSCIQCLGLKSDIS